VARETSTQPTVKAYLLVCCVWRRTYTSRESSGSRTGLARWCCASRRSTGPHTFTRRSTAPVPPWQSSGTRSRSAHPHCSFCLVEIQPDTV